MKATVRERSVFAVVVCVLSVFALGAGNALAQEPPLLFIITPEFGPATGGTTVTIAGFSFAPDATVTIGGTDATVTNVVNNDPAIGWIIATTPPGDPGPADVVVTNPGIGSDTLEEAFTYLGPPSITVTSPNGGEVWAAGNSYDITWSSTGLTGGMHIYLYEGASYPYTYLRTLATNVPVTAGSWTWNISSGETPGIYYRIRLRTVEDPVVIDYSDACFAITGVEVTSPNGGEVWAAGNSYDITWSSTGLTGGMDIQLYEGASYPYTYLRALATNVPVTAGWWTWDIPSGETPGVNYRIRLRTLEAPVAIDYSDGTYEIGLIQDVTLLVESSLSHVQYNRRTGESFGIVTVANISGGDFLIPITAVIEDISTPNVTVKNHDGTTDTGDPYFDLSDLATGGVLPDGEEVSFEIVFDNTTRERFIFSIGVYALVPSP